MNLQSLIVVVVRLLARQFALKALVQTVPILVRLIPFGEDDWFDYQYRLVPLAVLVALCVGALLLWVYAASIAGLVSRGGRQDLSFGSVSLADCYSIAFIGVGVFYIAGYLAPVLNWSHYLLKSMVPVPGQPLREGVSAYDVSSTFIPFIVGILLFLNGRSWALRLAQKQKSEDSPDRSVEATADPPRR